jgi:predicted PolB exonuclease-like 3'-5' exonuclease
MNFLEVMMFQDEIVEEIHRIREEYSRSFNHDLKAIFADLQKQQAESGKEVVNLPRKPGLPTRWSGRMRELGEDAKDSSCR